MLAQISTRGTGALMPGSPSNKKSNTMKKLLLTLLASASFAGPAAAVYFDTNAFGQSLNGWKKNRTALYSIDNNTYRTHVPTLSPTPGGGMFVSTRVDHRPRMGKLISSYLELTFSPQGHLITGQIRLSLDGKRITTGQIEREPNAVEPPADSEAPIIPNAEPWKTPEGTLVASLFKAYDAEMNKLSKTEGAGKQDIFARMFGKSFDHTDLAAALRHNLNFVLKNVR